MSGGIEKVNAVKYFPKPPTLTDAYYYEEDTYAVNDQAGRGVPTKLPRFES